MDNFRHLKKGTYIFLATIFVLLSTLSLQFLHVISKDNTQVKLNFKEV